MAYCLGRQFHLDTCRKEAPLPEHLWLDLGHLHEFCRRETIDTDDSFANLQDTVHSYLVTQYSYDANPYQDHLYGTLIAVQ